MWNDYLSPYPLFDDKHFQQIFLHKQSNLRYDKDGCSDASFFAKHDYDCCGQETVGLDCKLLMALKANAYGVAANAFHDYFQMGESTACKCCKCFNEALTHCKELMAIIFWKMTKANAQRVLQLHHFQKHGIHGMLGCLDCMHVVWKNCPVALHGTFTGKKKACQHWFLRSCQISIYGSGMWPLDFEFAGALTDPLHLGEQLASPRHAGWNRSFARFWILNWWQSIQNTVLPGRWNISQDSWVCKTSISSYWACAEIFCLARGNMQKYWTHVWCLAEKISKFYAIHLKNGTVMCVLCSIIWWYKSGLTATVMHLKKMCGMYTWWWRTW